MSLKGLDAHAGRSRFRRLDPRSKFLSLFLLIIVVAILRDVWSLVTAFTITMILVGCSGIPISHLGKHFAITTPVIIFTSISLYFTSGPDPALAMLLRISSSILLLLFLGSTTPFYDLLKGLQALHLPRIYVLMILFVHRYIFIFADELSRMRRARMARGFTEKGNLRDTRIIHGITSTAGMVLVRAYSRGIRFHHGLQSRGFQGKIHTMHPLKIQGKDMAFSFIMILLSSFLVCMEFGVIE